MRSFRQINWVVACGTVILLTLAGWNSGFHPNNHERKAERTATILHHTQPRPGITAIEWNNESANLQFVEKRHKRALAAYIYFHQPVLNIGWYVFDEPPRPQIYQCILSEKNYFNLSLRGPPAAC